MATIALRPVISAIIVLVFLVLMTKGIIPPIWRGLGGGTNAALEAACQSIAFIEDDPAHCTTDGIVKEYEEMTANNPEGFLEPTVTSCNTTIYNNYRGEYDDVNQGFEDRWGDRDKIIEFCAAKCCVQGGGP